MKSLRHVLDDYLETRRALGYKLADDERLLRQFVAHVEKSGSAFVTISLSVAWATQPERASRKWWAQRLGIVRSFAKYVQAFDTRTEIPAAELIPYTNKRPTPYLYSDEDVQALMGAARGERLPFRGATYSTLVGLLATTGLRIGEAIKLDRTDFFVSENVLLIRDSKFGKSREVLIHPTTCAALQDYARERDQVFPHPSSPSFFLSMAGKRLIYKNVHWTVARQLHRAGVTGNPSRRPTLHGLRHTFAVRTLMDWYKDGLDVEARLPLLSTYLGHVNPSSTYWYLTAIPELMTLASGRLEQALGELP